MLFSRYAAIAAIVLCGPLSLMADEASPPSTQPEQVEVAPEVVVSAHRRDEPKNQVGQQVWTIRSEEFERKNMRYLIEGLREAPGVDVRQSGGPGALTSIFLRGTESDHTLLKLDGMPGHDPSATGNLPLPQHYINAPGLQDVEVLKGPSSAMHGSQAIGGVVNIQTRRGEGPMKANLIAELGVGSQLMALEQIQSSAGFEYFNYNFAVTRMDAEGISSALSGSERDPYSLTSFIGRFGIGNEIGGIDVFIRHQSGKNDVDDGGYEQNDLDFGKSTYSQTFVRAQPYLNLFDGVLEAKMSIYKTTGKRTTTGTTLADGVFKSDITGVDFQSTVNINKDSNVISSSFTAGFTYEKHEADIRGSEADFFTNEFFVQNILRLYDTVFITNGIRVVDHSDFGTEFVYSSAISYNIKQTDTIIRASIGTAYKTPSLPELYLGFGADDALQPEESIGFDIGVEQRFTFGDVAVLTASVTYFYNDIKNIIQNDPMTFALFNAEGAITQGVEAWAQLQLMEDLTFTANYTYTDTEILEAVPFSTPEGGRLARRPLHKANASVSWWFDNRKGNVTFSARYQGKQDDFIRSGLGELDGFIQLDIAASYWLTDYAQLTIRGVNLTDHGGSEVAGFNTQGPMAYLGLRLFFEAAE